jgi:hypothetical protein
MRLKDKRMSLDRIAYLVKKRFKKGYEVAEYFVGFLVFIRNKNRIRRAIQQGTITGTVQGNKAVLRPLRIEDATMLSKFFSEMPDEHLQFFRPHDFSASSLQSILKRPHYLTYGFFIAGNLAGYGILKLLPGRKTYRGRIVGLKYSGWGLGRFLSSYLSWQVSLLGFRARSTISRQNIKSLKTHEVEGAFDVIGELPNDYMLIEFHGSKCAAKPDLSL